MYNIIESTAKNKQVHTTRVFVWSTHAFTWSIVWFTCENHSNSTTHSQFTIWNLKKVRLIYVTGAQASFFKWLHLNMQHIFYKHLKLRDIGRVGDRVAFKNRGTSCWNWIHQYFKVWSAMNGKLNTLKWKLLYTNGHFKYGSKSNKKSSRSHQKVINSHLANVRVLCHQELIMTEFQVTISDVMYTKKTS